MAIAGIISDELNDPRISWAVIDGAAKRIAKTERAVAMTKDQLEALIAWISAHATLDRQMNSTADGPAHWAMEDESDARTALYEAFGLKQYGGS